MALSLANLIAMSATTVQKGIVEVMEDESPVLKAMPFVEVQGDALRYVEEVSLGGAAFRAIGSSYTESTGTNQTKVVPWAVIGGYADVDSALVKTQGNAVVGLRADAEAKKAKALSREFQRAFIKGNTATSPNEFNGLSKILTGSATQELVAGEDGIEVNATDATDEERNQFFDHLRKLVSALKGSSGRRVLFTNDEVLNSIQGSAARLLRYTETVDFFGTPVTSFMGIPIVSIGDDANGDSIIGTDETVGASTDCSSIYAVRFDTSDGVLGFTAGGGVEVKDLGEVPTSNAYRTKIELIAGMAVKGRSAAVLRGVRA